jgi:rhodanese-related sulfurtransferase
MEGLSLRQRLYPEFARVGNALASEKRLELVDLLAQAERHVEALAAETGMSVASVSQHLQVLRAAKLVDSERDGNRIVYRLADTGVLRLWLALRSVGEQRLPEVDQIRRQFESSSERLISRDQLAELLSKELAFLLDVRPRIEYGFGHLPGAVNLPLNELEASLAELPRDRLIVTYCRGVYCLMSKDAERLLARHGFNVARLEGGWPEWWDEGRPVSAGSAR